MGERRIVIDPVTRIEGHARVTLHLNEDGEVVNARFHVTQFRAFEKLCEGRPFSEMPSLMARIYGICPVSHLIASAKACDQILAVAVQLRRLLNLAQLVQSHALSFFYLSAPDFLLGMDSDPARRNLFGLIESHPETAREGIRLRKFGQQLIGRLAGKRIHPAWVVPGGVSEPLPAAARDAVLGELPEMRGMVQRTLGWFKSALEPFREEAAAFANFPTLFLGLVGADGGLEHYDGQIRVVDAAGRVVADDLVPERYRDYLGEAGRMSVLILGYGNPLAGDDGAGWRAAEALASSLAEPSVRVRTCRQLTPELAGEAAEADLMIFLDASVEIPPGTLSCRRVQPEQAAGLLSHHFTQEALLALAEQLYGRRPEAVLFSIGARSFSGPALSSEVEGALPGLLEQVRELVARVAQAGKPADEPAGPGPAERDFFSVMH